ncbi:MAG: cytochrome c3 family protein [Planctomycetota bacterium]|jgi:nitrate/TMAO reductase-like tetraheme cytochrome c subunit
MSEFGKKVMSWAVGVVRKRALTFLVGFVFAILCFVGLNAAMEPSSASEYCGSKCHEMKTAYTTWELSVHGANKYGFSVECVSCHLPPKDKFFTHVAVKAYTGAKDIYKHHFGGKYNSDKIRKKVLESMRDKTCVYCHDNLLAKPSGPAARIAHMASLAQPDSEEAGCLACHEDAGHQRKSKLFSP